MAWFAVLFLVAIALMVGRWWHLLAELVPKRVRAPAGILFALLPLALVGNFALPSGWHLVRTAVGAVAALWMFCASLFVPLWICWEAARLARRLLKRPPLPPAAAGRIGLGLLLLFAALAAFSFVNAVRAPDVAEYEFRVDGKTERPLRVAFFSDLHFDALYLPGQTERLAEAIEALAPDAVLFGGDLSDADTLLLSGRGLGDALRRIAPPLGIWATTGNHEAYLGRAEEVRTWAANRGWRWLLDSTACVGGAFCVTGRTDPQVARRTGTPRADLASLRPDSANASLPWIVLDHQPQLGQREAVEAGADLVLSGHTHDGQQFPWNLVVKAIYENPHGAVVYGKNGHHGMAVTSSGFGTWGMPFRLATSSEVVLVTLKGRN